MRANLPRRPNIQLDDPNDYNHGERDSVNGRFTLAREDIDLLGAANVEAPSNGIMQSADDYTAVGMWSHIFNNRVVNQLRVQFAD